MYPDLANWRYSTVTSQSTTDAGMGTPLLSSGRRPRIVTSLSCYWGTNTATSINMRYFIYPETAVTIDGNGQVTIAGDLSFSLGFVSADMGSGGEMEPLQAIGIGAKGQSNMHYIMPPNSMLVAAPSVNQNGTVIHKVISAEV